MLGSQCYKLEKRSLLHCRYIRRKKYDDLLIVYYLLKQNENRYLKILEQVLPNCFRSLQLLFDKFA